MIVANNINQIPLELPEVIYIQDHHDGFDQNYKNKSLDLINQRAKLNNKVQQILYHEILEDKILKNYQNLNITFSSNQQRQFHTKWFENYNIHPTIDYKNFICSFNGSAHVSRKFLVAILKKHQWFNPQYCSKNFVYDSDVISGHVRDYFSNEDYLVYNKFFCNSDAFNQTVYTFGHNRFEHNKNIYTLEHKLTESFLHIVSETVATSYYPYITEKSFYSIVTRGLFLSYAQPGWHAHLEKYYGFKQYTKLFDYRFDSIENPVERLVELMSMISKFSILSSDDWRDLYLIEMDTIEYNYDHYFSGGYLKNLEKYE